LVAKKELLDALRRQTVRLQIAIVRREKLSGQYSWARLGIFIVGALLSVISFYINFWVGLLVLVLSVAVFATTAYFHAKVENSLSRHRQWLRQKRVQIARIELDWQNIPPSVAPPAIGDHPFETDLDITGDRSIHRLLDTAVSREGSLRLRSWLLDNSPDPAIIKNRQELVGQLCRMSRFRGRLQLVAALSAREGDGQIEGQALVRWLHKPNPHAKAVRQNFFILTGLAAATIILAVLRRLEILPDLWIGTFLAYLILFFGRYQIIGELFDDAFTLQDGLRRLSAVLTFLERYDYRHTPAVGKLCAPFLDPTNRPSRDLRQAARIVSGASLQKNPILWFVVNLIIPWDYYFSNRLNTVRGGLAKTLPIWLERWVELESLCSLAEFAWLNPEHTFPKFATPGEAAPVLSAERLGHPLIPYNQKVANDFTLAELGQALIITGSNMSGKSSFLRTLGLNLRLAYCGSVVDAGYLRVHLLRVFTCIKVSDSVTDGFSYFYAEVRRLKALLDELERPDALPLFFLIDEIFRGTNNRERLTGSRAYVRALVGRNGAGAISTHDLELVRLADENPRILNYHFREEVIGGEMVFDYKLRAGPSPTTNALKIMRLAGLPVE
jgi:hypothetical protein